MSIAPRLEINLDKIEHNARTLATRLAGSGISVTGITKAVLGSAEVSGALLRGGVNMFGDSRIENIEAMRSEGITAELMLTRSPMLSQAERVVASADVSFNTEILVMEELSHFAQKMNKTHSVLLMVELGDLREGIMPKELLEVVRETLLLPNIALKGIGGNLACRSGVVPDNRNMAELSALAELIETTFEITLDTISGGNSANLPWLFGGADIGRINNLRLGESILLGCEPLHRQPIEGLFTDAFTLIAEVIESKTKPSQPWGDIAQTAFGAKPPSEDRGFVSQAILAVGLQDTDTAGIFPPSGIEVLGASSDHIILESGLAVGDEMRFGLNYSAMVRAMTSPFVAKEYSTPNRLLS